MAASEISGIIELLRSEPAIILKTIVIAASSAKYEIELSREQKLSLIINPILF